MDPSPPSRSRSPFPAAGFSLEEMLKNKWDFGDQLIHCSIRWEQLNKEERRLYEKRGVAVPKQRTLDLNNKTRPVAGDVDRDEFDHEQLERIIRTVKNREKRLEDIRNGRVEILKTPPKAPPKTPTKTPSKTPPKKPSNVGSSRFTPYAQLVSSFPRDQEGTSSDSPVLFNFANPSTIVKDYIPMISLTIKEFVTWPCEAKKYPENTSKILEDIFSRSVLSYEGFLELGEILEGVVLITDSDFHVNLSQTSEDDLKKMIKDSLAEHNLNSESGISLAKINALKLHTARSTIAETFFIIANEIAAISNIDPDQFVQNFVRSVVMVLKQCRKEPKVLDVITLDDD